MMRSIFSFELFRKIFSPVALLMAAMALLLFWLCGPQPWPTIMGTALILLLFIGIAGGVIHERLAPFKAIAAIAAEFIRKGRICENRYVADTGEMGILTAAVYRMVEEIGLLGEKLKTVEAERGKYFRTSEQNRARLYSLHKDNEKLQKEIESYKKNEESLRKSEERYRAMLENIEEYFYEADLLGNLVFFNDALNRMLGYSKNELVGKNFREIMDDETSEKAFRTFQKAFETGTPAKGFEWRLIKKDGSICYVEISVALIRDREGAILGFRGVARDVSDLIYMVYHDSLTGLYNRKAFFERLKETLALGKRDHNEKNIFYMDLDKFKKVNDDFGHDVGDEILKEVASRLKTTLRETDHICRLGGDEFTMILNNTHCPQPEEAARRVVEALSEPYRINDLLIDFVTPSIGISSYPRDASDIETLIKCADMAMYEAKKVGGRYWFYGKDLEEKNAQAAGDCQPETECSDTEQNRIM
jgi:diguanylate cyclase (GGDEF)-like protein/PAS domain S-box-containing protein